MKWVSCQRLLDTNKNELRLDFPDLIPYNPSLPLADTKWSLFWLHLFSIYAVYSVFMRLLEF